jgi:hypothetical protein
MLRALDELVESRIRDAQQRGEFAGLPGEGRPLPEEDLTGVPETLRVAHRILKNAGCVPAEVAALRDLDTLLAQIGTPSSAGAVHAGCSPSPWRWRRAASAVPRPR